MRPAGGSKKLAPIMDLSPVQPTSSGPARKSRLRNRKATTRALGPGGPAAAGSSGEGGEGPDITETDRRRLCEETLTEGYVQSFVDFFYLTHRPDPQEDGGAAAAETGAQGKEIDVPVPEMMYIRDNLTNAENARRQGDTGLVYGAYANLAQHYQNVKDPKTGVYFYEKCLEIARLTGDKKGEMAANNDLGLIYQSMDDVANATRYHERHLELATLSDMPQEETVAARELIKVYRKVAEAEESKSQEEAVKFYQKCLEASQLAADRGAEGLAYYRLGRSHVMLEEPGRAVTYLEDFERICKELQDKEGEGDACQAIAAAYQMQQNDLKAEEYLQRCLVIARDTENLIAQGEACCALGVIFNKRGEYHEAVNMFEKNFEIARSSVSSGNGDTRNVDISRVYLGMARGNEMLNQYLHVINQKDLKDLLLWKTRRTNMQKH